MALDNMYSYIGDTTLGVRTADIDNEHAFQFRHVQELDADEAAMGLTKKPRQTPGANGEGPRHG